MGSHAAAAMILHLILMCKQIVDRPNNTQQQSNIIECSMMSLHLFASAWMCLYTCCLKVWSHVEHVSQKCLSQQFLHNKGSCTVTSKCLVCGWVWEKKKMEQEWKRKYIELFKKNRKLENRSRCHTSPQPDLSFPGPRRGTVAGSLSYAMRRNTQLWMASAICKCRKLQKVVCWRILDMYGLCMVLHGFACFGWRSCFSFRVF